MPGGRPTDYLPEYCEIAEAKMREGFSKTATAGHLGICKATLDNWCKAHPEFLGAIKRGETARTLKLETDLLSAPDGPTVTSRIFALKNAAPDEWRDRKELDHTSSDQSMSPTRIELVAVSHDDNGKD
jgi:transposase